MATGPMTPARAPEAQPAAPAAEVMQAWQCTGCGRIEGAQPCIGVCQDRPVKLVYADDYQAALRIAAQSRERANALEAVVLMLAHTMPRDGQWERCYRALQDRAREVLADQRAVLSKQTTNAAAS